MPIASPLPSFLGNYYHAVLLREDYSRLQISFPFQLCHHME